MQRVRLSSPKSPAQNLENSQTTISPTFRLPAIPSNSLDPAPELPIGDQPLIPGLPDDISLQCLTRVRVDQHVTCSAVCKRWYSLFGSKDRFFNCRKQLGFHDPWLFVFVFHKGTGNTSWMVLDLVKLSWHKIPAMPCKDKVCPQGFRCVSFPHEGVLFVCGGVASDIDCPLNLVLRYEILENRWTVLKKMMDARTFFASGVIDGILYVAGGNSTTLFELDSAESFDPKKGSWESVSSMRTNMTAYDAAILGGKLLVTEGWLWPFDYVPKGQIYDPRTDKWEDMAAGLREGWTGSSVVIYGRLFVVTEHERMKLKVYDEGTDSWDLVEGPPLPELICKPFCVHSWDCEVYVVGRNLHVAVGHITKRDLSETYGKKLGFCVRWKIVCGPGALMDLIPSSAQVLFG